MKKSSILYLAVVLSFSLLLTGCGKSIEEKVVEKSIENTIGGDVDINNDSVVIKNEYGTWQAGEGVNLPDNWPDDVYVPAGKIITSNNTDLGKGVSLEVDKSVAELKTEYENKIKNQGWDINMSFVVDDNVTIGAKKDSRSLSVSISNNDEGKTVMVITLL